MDVIRPLQLSFNHRVLEQDRKFYFIASATLGINLSTGEELLEFDFFKDAFECMGDMPLPDPGMPKPNGEFLVSGSFYAADGTPVTGGEIMARVGDIEKRLYVFGPRYWSGGRPAGHEPISTMPVDYAHAFGGEGYDKNPSGMGYKDGNLPCIEDPGKIVTSESDRPGPAGFSPLDPSWPQRMRFQGTYDRDYKQKYFPGYPADLDWRFFQAAPEDQWEKGHFQGEESFEIVNMHPEAPVIKGKLPGLYARCFIKRSPGVEGPEFEELHMNLDTVWLFPEKMLALLIWRKGIMVADDEAEELSHVLLAYEAKKDEARTADDYRKSLELRINSDDPLLNFFNTGDLIPLGHKCAMELLQDKAEEGGEDNEMTKNMDAKAAAIQQQADEQIDEALAEVDKGMEGVEVPPEGQVDIKKMAKGADEAEPDPEVEDLKAKMEAILPGITSGEAIRLKDFSFEKMDQLFEVMEEFTSGKEQQAKQMAEEQISKVKENLESQLISTGPDMPEVPEEQRKEIEEAIAKLDEINLDQPPPAPLPRLNAEELIAQMPGVPPEVMEAMQHLNAAKQMGADPESTAGLEEQVKTKLEESNKMAEEGVREAEKAFRSTYLMSAHHMEDGLSPHNSPVEEVRETFLAAIAAGEDVSNRDWACIDLSEQDLSGVDLTGAYLEQVNFRKAVLKGAVLKGAILARADLEDADLSGADLEGANAGAVHALRTGFTDANLKSARLSKGDFTDADFSRANLEDIESLEMKINGTVFDGACAPGLTFIEASWSGVSAKGANLDSSIFYDCDIKDTDFSTASMARTSFADVRFENVKFDQADLESTCYVATDPAKASMKGMSFKGASLQKSNFQELAMEGADFSGANLENANFMGSDLSGANLKRASAKSAFFKKARLAGANLDGINLMEGSLAKAYLVDASFVGANLFTVDFLRSTITNTDFTGSNLESTLIENWRPQ